jgi:hypothetical protein
MRTFLAPLPPARIHVAIAVDTLTCYGSIKALLRLY